MAFTGAKKRSIYEIQINQCTFFWRCNSGNVDFFHCDGGDGTLVVWGVICLIGLLSRPLSLPWWWLWGSHSNALDGMKCVFITKKKDFFLQKKVLLCSDIITFHAVQCITRGAPKPPPRLSGPGLDVLEQQGQQDAVINKDNVIITNRSGRWWPWSGRYGHGREVMDIVEEVMDIVGEVMNITREVMDMVELF